MLEVFKAWTEAQFNLLFFLMEYYIVATDLVESLILLQQ